MLKKLIKYDIKSLSNTLFPIYGITILLSVISVIFQKLYNLTPIFRVPMGLITSLATLLGIGVTLITFIVGIQKYYNQTAKDEAYLIHTLPVKKESIILSKLVSQTLFQILSCIITFITVSILAQISIKDMLELISEIIRFFTDYSAATFIITLVLMLITYITTTLLIYVSVSFGQKHTNNKLKYSVGYGIIIYIITQIITSIIYTPLLMNKDFINELNKTFPTETILNITFLIVIGFSLVTSTIYFYITARNLDKKLNLE